MNWMPGILALTCVLSVAGESAAQSEFRTFTSENGQSTMKARILRTVDTRVEIERDNGKKYTVAPEKFQADDAAFIREWIKQHPAPISYSFAFKEQEQKRDSKEVSITGFKYFHQERWYYEVSVQSRTKVLLKNLDIKYRVWVEDRVKFFPERAVNRAGLVNALPFVSGSVQLATLAPNETKGFTTRDAKIDRARTGASDMLDGRKNERDRLRGVWVRIHQNGKMIYEWKSDLIPPQAKWETEPETG